MISSVDRCRFAGGPADVAIRSRIAVVPWLCVTVFRRFCSEQRGTSVDIAGGETKKPPGDCIRWRPGGHGDGASR